LRQQGADESQIKWDEMAGTCGNAYSFIQEFSQRTRRGKHYLEELDVDGSIILRYFIRKLGVEIWVEFIFI
jgi:hypothetical protein